MTKPMRTKIPRYSEGDWFAVPLRDGRFAAGVVARAAPKGRILLGYFFGPARQTIPSIRDLEPCIPGTAALIALFGDLGLIRGEWPIIGRTGTWNRADWPVPVFARVDAVNPNIAFCVEYSPDDPSAVMREYRCSPEDAAKYPIDRLMGYGSVENALTVRFNASA